MTYSADPMAVEATWASAGRSMSTGRLGKAMTFTEEERRRAEGGGTRKRT